MARKVLLGLILLGVGLSLISYATTQTQSTEFITPTPAVDTSHIFENQDGAKIKVLFLRADDDVLQKPAASERLRRQLQNMVDSGDYDIIKVNTIYDGKWLVAAEVYYRIK